MRFRPWDPYRTDSVPDRPVSAPWGRVCILASAQHFPEQWVLRFGTTAQTSWLSSHQGPSVRPLGSWTA